MWNAVTYGDISISLLYDIDHYSCSLITYVFRLFNMLIKGNSLILYCFSCQNGCVSSICAYVWLFKILCVLFIYICCMLYVCLCIKYICGYVWLDDFKLLCAFLCVLYVVCMLCHVCVVQCIVEFKSSLELCVMLVVHASTLNKTYLFIYLFTLES